MPVYGFSNVFFYRRACCSWRRILMTSIGEAMDFEMAAETPLSMNSMTNCQKGDHSAWLSILNQNIIIGRLKDYHWFDKMPSNIKSRQMILTRLNLMVHIFAKSSVQFKKQRLVMTQLVLQFILFLLANLANAQYNTQLARQSCLISKLASSPNCTQCQQGLTDLSYFQVPLKKLKGVAAYNSSSKTFIIAFQGTKDAENWKANLKMQAKKYDYCNSCTMHTGFAEAALLLYPEVAKAVTKLVQLYGPVPIVMTGHSLGGALAAIVGLQLMQQLKLNTTFSLYTFGAPRAGNKQFSDYANKMFKEAYRVVYKRDAVPHLPPKTQGYTHFGTEIWYQTQTSYKTCTGDNKEKCSNSVFLMLLKKSDHKLDNYLKLYEEKANILLFAMPAKDELQADGLQGYELLSLIAEYEKRKQISEFAN